MKFLSEVEDIEKIGYGPKIGPGYLVVYKWYHLSADTFPKRDENAHYISERGEVLWVANGMQEAVWKVGGKDKISWELGRDVFVGMIRFEGRVQLLGFNTCSYDVDMETGRVTFSQWHK